MKNRKLTLAASLVLVIALLLSSFSVAAVDGDLSTTDLEPTTDVVTTEPTTTPSDDETTTPSDEEPTTEPSGDLTTTETTTDSDGYYDNSDYETEEEQDAYDDGYWDGYYDGYEDAKDEYNGKDYDDGYWEGYDNGYNNGYWDGEDNGYNNGYYEGYYDAIQEMENKDVVTVFDRWDAFIEDLRERIEMFLDEIRDLFERIFKTGDYAPIEPIDPDNSDFIPGAFENTLVDDENAEAICNEFNDLVNYFIQDVPADVAITKTVNVNVQANDLPSVIEKIVQPIIDNYLIADSTTNYYYEGDWAYGVQSTRLMPQFLTVAEKTVNEDGTTDYRFEVVEEAAYYDGYETRGVRKIEGEIYYYALQHEYIADAIYVEDGYIDPITVLNAEIVYPGATVTGTTDAQGRLIKYDVNMPVQGTATGKIGMIKATVSLSGHRNEGFVMDYDV